MTIALEGDRRRFVPHGARRVWLGDERHAYHNGWARLVFAEYETAGEIVLEILPGG